MANRKPARPSSSPNAPDLVVVGSVGIDTIETPKARKERILGGSASYACAAASFFTRVGMVGVVGEDFPGKYRKLYDHFGIHLDGLQVKPGKTFFWSGIYEENMDIRRTLVTDLNVFADFSPELPESYRDARYVFLANISPDLQARVLTQMRKPRFVMLDTMDLWINVAVHDLMDVIGRVTLLTLNEHEARHLTGKHSLVKAAKALLESGPKYVCIKKGEHGSVLFTRKGAFMMPAYPLEVVNDPTGAGDTFAGGFIGALARMNSLSETSIRKAMTYGSVIASFGVEAFSLDRLSNLSLPEIEQRARELRTMGRIL
ncbi:MAG TPA: PfkB family carbohydrate kinase [Kiritimatiellia bacterium]|nr:PfkB family carbohydrate kinase [Kiritimatiellia bacterium]